MGIIDYMEVPKRGFNIFLDKDSHLLVVFYEWKKNTDIRDYKVIKVVDWTPDANELHLIKEDWDIIEQYVRRGQAHLLSERHTKYLSACTKGVGHGKDFREQPFSLEPAKQRALSFKPSFVSMIFNTRDDVGKVLADQPESILSRNLYDGEKFESYILGLYKEYIGHSCSEIEKQLNIDLSASKQYHHDLALSMAKLTHAKQPKEFTQAGIIIKTVRVRKDGWKPKESMSFPFIRYDDIIKEDWENSTFYSQLDHRFFTPVFGYTDVPSKQTSKDLVFKGAFFWSISDEDLPVIKSVWEETKALVDADVFQHFARKSDNRIVHIRPHARKKSDMADYKGEKRVKLSFWLNDTFIQGIVGQNLSSDHQDTL